MKITVQDDPEGGAFGAMQVRIKDLSAELERITVKVFGLHLPARGGRPIEDIRTRTGGRKQFQQSLFARMLNAVHIAQPMTPPPAAASNAASAATKTIEIKLSLPTIAAWPSVKELVQKLLAWPLYRVLASVLIITLIILVIPSTSGSKAANASNPTKSAGQSAGPPPLERGKPSYATVLPAGKSINSLGGWARVSPPGRSPVYAFIDKVGHVQLNVSEQPLPTGFTTDTESQVAALAENFNATAKVTAKEGTIIHIGNSVNGPQSAIFAKKQLLILIKTTAPLSNNQWVAYVSSLK